MKIITRDDLLILLNYLDGIKSYSEFDISALVKRYGDEYFAQDGELVKNNENKYMREIKEAYEATLQSSKTLERIEKAQS